MFDAEAPRPVNLPGRIDSTAEGRVLRVVSEGANGDLEAALRRLGAREVRFETLPLKEILVAFLKRGSAREADHV